MKNSLSFGLVLLALLLAGCVGLPGNPFAAAATATPTSAPLPPTSTAVATPPASPTPPGPTTLVVWVPPEFDPAADTPAGDLFNARLAEFTSRRPDIRVEVRAKAVDGAGGLLESLAAAAAAAQGALPDLVALPYPVFQAAGQAGLLRPLNGLTHALDEPDWYDYAREMAHLQNSALGLPFAGDALLQVYRPQVVAQPLQGWQPEGEVGKIFSFAAGDPQALFPLALYQANGGEIIDEQGKPTLIAQPLEELLAFFAQAEGSGVMTEALTEFQVQDQADGAFVAGQADMLATWASHYLRQKPPDAGLALLPAPDQKPFTLMKGWVWALPGLDDSRRELAAELAEFLTESSYLAEWSEAAGYLPARPSALAAWSDSDARVILETVSKSGRLIPANDLLSVLGPALQNATMQILKRASDPASAALEAVQSLEQK
jgi:ABC-type glycerol-3-phosphate transport system substrate-binding protein